MRLGSYYRVGLLISISLFSFYCYSNPLLFAGARFLLPRVFGEVVAKRAASTAVAEITSGAINRTVTKELAKIPFKGGLLRNASGAATWAGVGYSASQLDLFNSGDKSPDRSEVSNEKIINSDYQYSAEVFVSGGKKKFIYGDSAEAIASQIVAVTGPDTCTACTFTLKDAKIVQHAGINYVEYSYERSIKQSWGAIDTSIQKGSLLLETNPNYKPHSNNQLVTSVDGVPSLKEGVSYDQLLQQMQKQDLDIDSLTKLINQLLLNASAEPDYKGIPFSSSNPVTQNEVKQALSSVSNIWNQSVFLNPVTNNNGKTEVVILPGQASEPNTDLGENPEIKQPALDTPPTGIEILKPLTELMPFVNDMNITAKDVQCPKWEFELWNNNYSFDSHCILLERIRPILKAVFLLIWSLISLRIILSA